MKKPKKRRQIIEFQIAEVFPPDDELAIDILRLMAFQDDLSFISDFMRASLVRPKREAQRMSLQADSFSCKDSSVRSSQNS